MLESNGYLDPGKGSLKAVYVISVAAELAGMHPQTLRIYERKGLVDPIRTGGGSRRYSEEDVQKLRKIQELTNSGLNLEGVKKFIEMENEITSLRSQLAAAKEELKRYSEEVERQYKRELVPFSHTLTVLKSFQRQK